MLPSVPIFPVYNFFRQNIWHSIFDQFHFHHIFGDEMTVSSDKTGKGTNSRNISGTSWMVIWEKNFKYLKAEQVSQQISIFFKPKFHNEGGNCQKSYFEVFSGKDLIWHPRKFQPWQTPPSCFLPISPRFFDKYQMPIFFIEYLGSLQPVKLDWYSCDQNWAKNRPLHFQRFQILNATERHIVHWWERKYRLVP